MKNYRFKPQLCAAVMAVMAWLPVSVSAAMYEMGTGIPGQAGIYSQVTGLAHFRIWALTSPTIAFPAGCTSLILSRATLVDDYKIFVSVILTAQSLGRSVRFYAHAERDGGCGVDYVQMN
jgi:hypothetical protein